MNLRILFSSFLLVMPMCGAFAADSVCPFDDPIWCGVWAAKPTISETIYLPTRELDAGINISHELLARYKSLMNASRVCCAAGIENKLRRAGASAGALYRFMVDDANFYGLTDNCLILSDDEIDQISGDDDTTQMVAGVRDSCLCSRYDYFDALLSPFDDHADMELKYSYYDGLNRSVSVDVMADVRAVQDLLSNCL
ncbi:MAG: hypothetical protein LBL75_00430 [Rickettsiales bacterium]|jgi:hypothetical protein|nr:hypothetical protein [Rickettsiales bacterium]